MMVINIIVLKYLSCMSYGIGCHYLAHKIMYTVRIAYVCVCVSKIIWSHVWWCIVWEWVYMICPHVYIGFCPMKYSVKIFQNNLFTAQQKIISAHGYELCNPKFRFNQPVSTYWISQVWSHKQVAKIAVYMQHEVIHLKIVFVITCGFLCGSWYERNMVHTYSWVY